VNEYVSIPERDVGFKANQVQTPEIRREMIRHSTDYGFNKRGSDDYTYGGEI
jgi:hypothetical protein